VLSRDLQTREETFVAPLPMAQMETVASRWSA